MQAIVESERVRVERTCYQVPGWGAGELWTAKGVVLAHEFDFGHVSGSGAEAVADHSRASELVARVRAFLAGEDVEFGDVLLDLGSCTDFQRAALTALRSVPRGEVVTYGELAALAGHPGAHRAAGTFCARNRFLLFVPCHRVVAAGSIGGYGSAGLGVKRRLLALEGMHV
jgi:methylated-DNA-[protein]-cysteine S-methyltransferase